VIDANRASHRATEEVVDSQSDCLRANTTPNGVDTMELKGVDLKRSTPGNTPRTNPGRIPNPGVARSSRAGGTEIQAGWPFERGA
jgi:hypothetical protein